MNSLQWIQRLEQFSNSECILTRGGNYTYAELISKIESWDETFAKMKIDPGSVVGLESDFCLGSIAALFACLKRRCIAVPILQGTGADRKREYGEVASIEHTWQIRGNHFEYHRENRTASHPLLGQLKTLNQAGLVVFSSGSAGKPKAILHNMETLLDKFLPFRCPRRMLGFLMFDHFGGINTLFHSLANGGAFALCEDRAPHAVCQAIEQHALDVLPTTPTFLNLVLLSGAHREFLLPSLRVISYGTEFMPESLLKKVRAAFPSAEFQQTYGLSELGVFRAKSLSSDSVWVRVGGEGCDVRVREGLLEIKVFSAMLGYLNSPSPFTEDGWFRTGDVVKQNGDYLRILGRRSDWINVGGQKVLPTEVEEKLFSMEGVEGVTVYGEAHALLGQIVVAEVRLITPETAPAFRKRMVEACRGRLLPYQIPQKVILTESLLHSERYKKLRTVFTPLREEARPYGRV